MSRDTLSLCIAHKARCKVCCKQCKVVPSVTQYYQLFWNNDPINSAPSDWLSTEMLASHWLRAVTCYNNPGIIRYTQVADRRIVHYTASLHRAHEMWVFYGFKQVLAVLTVLAGTTLTPVKRRVNARAELLVKGMSRDSVNSASSFLSTGNQRTVTVG